MPKPPRAVKILLLINIVVYVMQLIAYSSRDVDVLSGRFGATPDAWWQVWRYVTFQFLHDPHSLFHVGLNMLGLYMLGSPLEQHWGSRKFVKFYLGCGAVAGIAYVVAGNAVGGMGSIPLIGASGGVFAIILACAVLFPQFRLILVLFPVPIRFACVLIFGAMGLVILAGVRDGQFGSVFWSDVAHLGGAGAAAVYIWIWPIVSSGTFARKRVRPRPGRGAWRRKIERQAQSQAEIDRVLDKIHQTGINSLSAREKKMLRDATRQQQEDDDPYS